VKDNAGDPSRGRCNRVRTPGKKDAPAASRRLNPAHPRLNPARPRLPPNALTSSPQVSELIGRFTEGAADREAPIHALRKALQLITSDCKAAYGR